LARHLANRGGPAAACLAGLAAFANHESTIFIALSAIAALTVSIVAESANAAGYARRDRDADAPTVYNTQANPHYGFGPRVRVQPNDVISGDRLIGRDPDPFIRGQILRNYR
jgi:hypothetical protein